MATTRKKTDKLDGTDRWTSKGYGIIPGPMTAAQKADVEKFNKEFAAQKKAKKPARKKG